MSFDFAGTRGEEGRADTDASSGCEDGCLLVEVAVGLAVDDFGSELGLLLPESLALLKALVLSTNTRS